MLLIIGGQADCFWLRPPDGRAGLVSTAWRRAFRVRRELFPKWTNPKWTNWCKGSPARLQMRREALCASGIRIQHQVAPAAAAIRQVNHQSSTVSPSTTVFFATPSSGGGITRRRDRIVSHEVKRSGSQKNVQTSSLRPSSTGDLGPFSTPTTTPSSPFP